ncbi:tryptophan--tRNA ligase [Candidatus Woesearchaeota archaeon]|nr:tryptophan--tRNA ligase [Candidatus Woesearchaeota archaeon]
MAHIDPWSSVEIEDYEHIFSEFGMEKIPDAWRKKLGHHLFRRGIVVAHRDFGKILQRMEAKKPFINMTGIATSGRLHLGHKVDIDLFLFFKSKGAKNYFAVSDIDAYVSRPRIETMADAKKIAAGNLAHLLAFGLEKEDIYLQSNKEPRYYEFAFEISKKITESTYRAIYGHTDLGKISAVLLQIADILHPQLKEYGGKMPSVTGIGLEQDPHAKITRDVAKRLPYSIETPSFIYFRHQSGLQQGKKMSSSEPDTAIFLDDSADDIKRKVNRAFSGGRDTLEEHRKLGGNPDVDKTFEILKFHHPDDALVKSVYNDYKSGRMLTGELKAICRDFLTETLSKHQESVEKKRKVAEQIVLG